MKKIILMFICVLLVAGLFAQEAEIPVSQSEISVIETEVKDQVKSALLGEFNWPFSLKSLNVGGTFGSNMNSREGWALAWGFHGDYELWDKLGFGFQFNMSHDCTEMFVMEPTIYAKWFMPFSLAMFEPFVRMDMGASFIMAEKTYGAFLAGITAGARVLFGNLYVEPMFSFGYPYCCAFNVAVGWAF